MDTTNKIIEDLCLDELRREYYNIKTTLSSVRLELDKKSQELHDCKRLLKTAEILEKEYQQEIEALQKNDSQENLILKSRVKKLEDNLVESKQLYSEQILNLKSILILKENELKQLQVEFKNVSEEITKQRSDDEIVVLKNDIYKLRRELEALNERYDEVLQKNDSLQQKNLVLEEQLATVNAEKENLKESLNVKREELMEANQKICTLQEEFVVVKNKMDALEQKPLSINSKGNSLFAEVNDRRVELQNNIKYMKMKYAEMKKDYCNLMKQISSLRAENVRLKDYWEAELSEAVADEKYSLQAYRVRIEVLETLVKKYKNELCEKQTEGNKNFNSDFSFLENRLEKKGREIESLRQELDSKSLELISVTDELKVTLSKLRKVKLENLGLQQEIDKMKTDSELINTERIFSKLQNLLCDEETSVTEQENDDIPIKKCIQNIDCSRLEIRKRCRSLEMARVLGNVFEEENKTNLNTTLATRTEINNTSIEKDGEGNLDLSKKKVIFSENVPSEEKPKRKGVKVIKTNPIIIRSYRE